MTRPAGLRGKKLHATRWCCGVQKAWSTACLHHWRCGKRNARERSPARHWKLGTSSQKKCHKKRLDTWQTFSLVPVESKIGQRTNPSYICQPLQLTSHGTLSTPAFQVWDRDATACQNRRDAIHGNFRNKTAFQGAVDPPPAGYDLPNQPGGLSLKCPQAHASAFSERHDILHKTQKATWSAGQNCLTRAGCGILHIRR